MEDEVAEAAWRSHLSHCVACQYFVSIHSMNMSVKKTLVEMHRSLDKYEKDSGKLLNW